MDNKKTRLWKPDSCNILFQLEISRYWNAPQLSPWSCELLWRYRQVSWLSYSPFDAFPSGIRQWPCQTATITVAGAASDSHRTSLLTHDGHLKRLYHFPNHYITFVVHEQGEVQVLLIIIYYFNAFCLPFSLQLLSFRHSVLDHFFVRKLFHIDTANFFLRHCDRFRISITDKTLMRVISIVL